MLKLAEFRPTFSTVVAFIALFMSGFSAVISWKSYSLNIESFGFNSNFTYDCPFSIGMTSSGKDTLRTSLGLCWQVTIANQSTARVSVLRYSGATSTDGHSSSAFLVDVQDRSGKQMLSPMSFDAGEARTVIVRVNVPITDALSKIINDAIKSKTVKIETLSDAAFIAAQAKLDVLGNPVSVSQISGWTTAIIQFPTDYKKTIVSFHVYTGRENVFATDLVYPSDFARIVSSVNAH